MVEKLNLTQEQQASLLERNKELETEKYYNSLLDERVYRATILQALSRMEMGLKDLKLAIEEASSEEDQESEPSKKPEDEFKKMWKEESPKPQGYNLKDLKAKLNPRQEPPKAWSPEEPEPEDEDDDDTDEDWDDTPKPNRGGRPRGS